MKLLKKKEKFLKIILKRLLQLMVWCRGIKKGSENMIHKKVLINFYKIKKKYIFNLKVKHKLLMKMIFSLTFPL